MAIRFLIAAVLGPHSEPFALSNSWHPRAHCTKVTKALRRKEPEPPTEIVGGKGSGKRKQRKA